MWNHRISLVIITTIVLAYLPHPIAAQLFSDTKHIRNIVKNTPRANERTLEEIIQFLHSKTSNPVELTQTIYLWIAQNITYDQQAYNNGNKRINKSIEDILYRKKAICYGYAQLFQVMCQMAGIQSEVITGYSKGSPTAQPDLKEQDHAWNAVYLNEKWYLLDVTWAKEELGIYRYFLTPPPIFIHDHLPGDPMWQLSSDTISTYAFIHGIHKDSIQSKGNFAFEKSIQQWQQFPLYERRLITNKNAYQFNPTSKNSEELGNAYIDLAATLTDTLDLLEQTENMQSTMQLQKRIIQLFEKAESHIDFFDWQRELNARILINYSASSFNAIDYKLSNSRIKQQLKVVKKRLEKAQDLLAKIEQPTFQTTDALQATKEYLNIINSNLKRL